MDPALGPSMFPAGPNGGAGTRSDRLPRASSRWLDRVELGVDLSVAISKAYLPHQLVVDRQCWSIS